MLRCVIATYTTLTAFDGHFNSIMSGGIIVADSD